MSVISDTVTDNVATILSTAWSIRDGQVVPTTDTVTLKNGAVKVDATYLYADLAGSSAAAQKLKKEVTAKVIRSYLNAATRIIRHFHGEIRSFDGDRVMGIFVGGSKNTNAASAALGINWAVFDVLQPHFKSTWPDIEKYYIVDHGVGIATGEALIVRGGVRDNSDLISIGEAPNVAAKLSDIRGNRELYVTQDVFDQMADTVKKSRPAGEAMWSDHPSQTIGGTTYRVKASSWKRTP